MPHPSNAVSDAEIAERYDQVAKSKRELADELMIDVRSLLSEAAQMEISADNARARNSPK